MDNKLFIVIKALSCQLTFQWPNQMVRGLDCVVGVAKSPIHISLANLASFVLCGCSVVELQNDPVGQLPWALSANGLPKLVKSLAVPCSIDCLSRL
ncbi:hypothetical protein ElyMa_004661900 [Elysia marginata]|uniref:Uncharacterized protein n=1 Tax=Elysia marginata TaxID=1093978 RepID=A0AAV4I301_9GAST|nr:hypothetical protein ElyMa_004661900 [Elysia marginata]